MSENLPGPSYFARAIKGLLDETDLFDRKSWSHVLDVSEKEIRSWLNDTSVPHTYTLGMILEVLARSTDIPKEPLRRFADMSYRSALEVSPHGGEMLPTVLAYSDRLAFPKTWKDLYSKEYKNLYLNEISVSCFS